MRLFIAVNFSAEIKTQILAVQDKLRAQCLKGNFSRPENLHITLAFLGETREDKIPLLGQIIENVNFPAFEVSFNRSGCFTHSHKELWWIGADSKSPGLKPLQSIQSQLISDLSEADFLVDARPFNAHVTLAREVKASGPVVLDCPGIVIPVDRISLMKSEHVKGMLKYTEILGKNLKYADKSG